MVITNTNSPLDKYRVKSTGKKSKLSKKESIALLASNWSALTVLACKIANKSTN